MKQDVYLTITNTIIDALETAPDCERPWNGIDSGMPHNPVGGYNYHGVNVLSLWVAQQNYGYSTADWATYKQWQSKGAQVRKGERSTTTVLFKPFEKEVDGKTEKFLVARAFSVFNAEQVDGYDVNKPEMTDLTERLAYADNFITATRAAIQHGGNQAFYRPSTDTVHMPDRAAFRNTSTGSATEGYYSVLLHELTHWTGTKGRCDRELNSGRFGNEAYAFEELVAELGAAFNCANLSISNDPRPDHAQYIASWIKVLKNDKKAIFTAASLAQKAIEYMEAQQEIKQAA